MARPIRQRAGTGLAGEALLVTRTVEGGAIRLGLGANLGQFSLLVLINAFVGAMVGLERTVVPLIGEREFGLASKTAIVSFIVSFGVTKALLNLVAARLAERFGRKPILVAGWLLGLPVPFMIMWAPRWGWVSAAPIPWSWPLPAPPTPPTPPAPGLVDGPPATSTSDPCPWFVADGDVIATDARTSAATGMIEPSTRTGPGSARPACGLRNDHPATAMAASSSATQIKSTVAASSGVPA